jgi:hypothetical protein
VGARRYGYFDFLEWKLSKERAFRRGIEFSKYIDLFLCVMSLFLTHRRGDNFIYDDTDEVLFLAIGGVNSIVKSVLNPFLIKRWYGM